LYAAWPLFIVLPDEKIISNKVIFSTLPFLEICEIDHNFAIFSAELGINGKRKLYRDMILSIEPYRGTFRKLLLITTSRKSEVNGLDFAPYKRKQLSRKYSYPHGRSRGKLAMKMARFLNQN
jgi:hypothetical protein